MDLADALGWARGRRNAVLITLRADGRPQSSDIAYALDGDTFVISVTDDRAKTRNMRRDPRVVLHLTDPAMWTYLSFDGTAELSPATTEPGDDTSNALVAYFEAVSGGPHPDWDEYRQAMVDEGRLVVRFTPSSVVGQVN
ncbi:MAG: PPOX class F420-dependent oxidoreductase [Acidimicrobiia bacterium]|nr:PPOX class F420-dependent oxidoreductase [Acidimicrobiia bacterium]